MSDECTRTYAVNPETAEEPCEDCGRDKRKHPAPTNVTPLILIHRCVSCGELVEHDKRFEPESHGATCRQPEIRMRRLESRVWEQEKRIADLQHRINLVHDRECNLAGESITDCPECHPVSLKDHPNASPEEPQPDTKRSAYVGVTDHFCTGGRYIYPGCEACTGSAARSHASAAEPEGSAPAGAVPPGAAGGDSGPGEGDARPPEGGD